MTARRIFYIDDMHKKYGPVVLISPNEVSFTSPEVFNEVHKIGNGYLKSDWYTKFRPGGPPDVFAVIDPKIHTFKRRLLARPFSFIVFTYELGRSRHQSCTRSSTKDQDGSGMQHGLCL